MTDRTQPPPPGHGVTIEKCVAYRVVSEGGEVLSGPMTKENAIADAWRRVEDDQWSISPIYQAEVVILDRHDIPLGMSAPTLTPLVTRTVSFKDMGDLLFVVDNLIDECGFGKVVSVSIKPTNFEPTEDERAAISGIEGGTWPDDLL